MVVFEKCANAHPLWSGELEAEVSIQDHERLAGVIRRSQSCFLRSCCVVVGNKVCSLKTEPHVPEGERSGVAEQTLQRCLACVMDQEIHSW